MKRRRPRKAKIGVQLFPFLAVLLCTMGALILLLVLTVQQAQVYAATTVRENRPIPAAPTIDAETLQVDLDEQELRREGLRASREEMSKELAQQRLALSHLEDHIRRLESRWKQLTSEADKLLAAGNDPAADAAATQARLSQMEAAIAKAKLELEEARRAAAGKRRKFAILPYDGPNGTRRRPIYIECTESKIVIQPEGTILRAEDFEGPMGQGNPLDAALRAAREYLARNGDTRVNGEPYPLLVVRPDGAVAYAAARSAMKAWDDEFGYELVDQELELSFPKPDAALAEELDRAVNDARQRQQVLAMAMPNKYHGKGRGTGGAVGGGTFVLDEDPAMSDALPGGNAPGSGTAGGVGTNRAGRSGTTGTQVAGADGAGMTGSRPGSGWEQPQANRSGVDQGIEPPPNSTAITSGRPASTGQASKTAASKTAASKTPMPGSLAKQRGKNWSTPDSNRGLTGITRPILVTCYPDRLVIQPERGERGRPEEIPLFGETHESVDEFARQIWRHVDRWGLAVAGGYWKPLLNVQVVPGAETRFSELQTLLEDSGIEVKRKP